jgi:hypothetical protein
MIKIVFLLQAQNKHINANRTGIFIRRDLFDVDLSKSEREVHECRSVEYS